MENWQKEHIRLNLVEMNENIRCTDKLIDYLISEGCLAKAERSHINEFGHDEEAKARKLLDILETKTSGYQCLARSLYKCGQTGALLTLLYGIEANITNSNAFRYCGIKLDTCRLLNMPVEFGGIALQLGDLCCNIPNIQNVISDNLNVTTFKELISGEEPVITLDTIPKPLPYYISRSIWIKSKLDERFFSEMDDDVFVIEGIELHQLTQLSSKHTGGRPLGKLTDRSSNQLDALTVRFILLEYPAHFAKIASNYQKIVHWIRYKNGAFYHVKTSGEEEISIVQKYLFTSEENTVSQSYFVSSCLATSEQNIIVLYDSPGMGKTVLLSDLAREFRKLHPTSIVVWKHCSDLAKMQMASTDIISTTEKITEEVTKMITVNKFGSSILQEILNMFESKLYLFLDAFDELSSQEQQTCVRILKCIEECSNNLKVVITSRPHGAESLEALTGTLGYNILPFQESDQVLFFLEYWNQQHSIKRTCALKQFARHCIKTFTEAVSSEEREITGIPLQCRMLADIYADAARAYSMISFSSSEILFVQPDCRVDSLFKMYEDYLNVKFSLLKSKEEKELYLRFHYEQAIELIFQVPFVILERHVGFVVDETTLYQVGIMELRNGQPAFVHRTFAEFLSAKFVMSVISEGIAYDLCKTFQTDIIPAVFRTIRVVYHQALHLYTFQKYRFSERTVHFFLNNFLKRNLNSSFISRAIGRLAQKDFMLMSYAALVNKCEYTFEFLISWYSGLNVIYFEGATNLLKLHLNAPQFSSNFLIRHNQKMLSLSAKYCSVSVVEKICNLLLSVSGKKWCEFEYDRGDNPLSSSIKRGNYQIVEYLINISGPQYPVELYALHRCTQRSMKNSDSTIANKVQIIKLLLQQYSECPTGVHEDSYSVDIFSEANVKLTKALIEAGVPLNDTAGSKQNVAHKAANCCSEKEYHELVTILYDKGYWDLFNRRDCLWRTPLHYALRRLDIWTETLDLLASKCQVTFNNSNYFSQTELCVAIKYGRSQRVIDDIVRLGGDINRATKKRCTCL